MAVPARGRMMKVNAVVSMTWLAAQTEEGSTIYPTRQASIVGDHQLALLGLHRGVAVRASRLLDASACGQITILHCLRVSVVARRLQV